MKHLKDIISIESIFFFQALENSIKANIEIEVRAKAGGASAKAAAAEVKKSRGRPKKAQKGKKK